MTMNETNDTTNSSLVNQLRLVLKDGIDYAGSVLRLLQAQAAALALSSVSFLVLIFFCVGAGVIGFILLSVALGMWLTNVTGHAGWALLIMGGIYFVLAAVAGSTALRWLKRLKS